MKKFDLLFSVCVYFCFVFFGNSDVFAQTYSGNPNPPPNYTINPQPNPYRNVASNNSNNKNLAAATQSVPATRTDLPEIMAIVNNEQITKKDVANESLRMFGDTVLKDLIKRTLVEIECRRRNIVITQNDINAEILRMAKAFNFSTADWLELIERERGITAEQYMQDIICPILGIAKLAGSDQVNNDDLRKAYESKYGESVQVRQIVLRSKRDAQRIHAEVTANPESFSNVAKNNSVDPASQPYGGLIHPIRRHNTDKIIEDVVFSLREGQISPIVEWAETFIIFRCEKHLPKQNVNIDQVRDRLITQIRDEKTRKTSEKFFNQLLKTAKIEKVFGDPMRMSQNPGIAAIVNNHPITLEILANLCVKRYGKEVLNDMINRLVIIQECRKNKIVITDRDIDMELHEMAIKNLPLKKDGKPDVERWMELAIAESGMTAQVYRTNTVYPILALKRLAKNNIQITEADLQKSMESNFGEKVRCLAITFEYSDHRRAMEVWNMAKMNPNEKYFRELAEKYSSDPTLRLSGGVIPLIYKHSNEPVLEEAAFNLQIGELSQIISVNDSLMILYCVGKEPASNVKLEDVKPELIADLYDKKQKIAVTNCYEILYKKSTIINHLIETRTEGGITQKFDQIQQQGTGTANKRTVPATPIYK
ncbi:MAG: peptidylprolyl isomerase [Planctomycetaceae bacterium]|jgi:parvulin-like peptidyl-prolyl isomerase|nr:peptidylprolyl isomerase [Planctomycetaceae bacterium]